MKNELTVDRLLSAIENSFSLGYTITIRKDRGITNKITNCFFVDGKNLNVVFHTEKYVLFNEENYHGAICNDEIILTDKKLENSFHFKFYELVSFSAEKINRMMNNY
jgi:hypothetical protein